MWIKLNIILYVKLKNKSLNNICRDRTLSFFTGIASSAYLVSNHYSILSPPPQYVPNPIFVVENSPNPSPLIGKSIALIKQVYCDIVSLPCAPWQYSKLMNLFSKIVTIVKIEQKNLSKNYNFLSLIRMNLVLKFDSTEVCKPSWYILQPLLV